MSIYKYIIFMTLVIHSSGETFDDFFQFVNNSIASSDNYVLPINNEALYRTKDASVKDYGHYDFIIVGGGSAGSIVAARLSEVSHWKVLLLEAGGNQTNFSDVPAFNNYALKSDMDWGYFTAPQTTVCQGMINNTCVYPRGKVLGGCAVSNGIINARGIPADYDRWEQLGNHGWSYPAVLNYFKKIENNNIPNLDDFFHGRNGPIHNNYTSPPSVVADTFMQGNIERGLPAVDYNGKGIIGVSRIQFNIKGNIRDNSAHAYVDPAQHRTNFNITLRAFASKILVSNQKAYGVEFIKNGQTYQAFASREVILSAGSVNSPQILMLSGIGPADKLRSLGIPVKNNLPAVGKNLQDHPMFVNFFIRTNRTSPDLSLYENLRRYAAGLTPFTNGGRLESLAFINTKNNTKLRDIEYITAPPPFSVQSNLTIAYNFRDEIAQVFKDYNALTDVRILVILLKPKSRGSVTLKSNSPKDFPLIDVNYFSDPNNDDIETMYQGIKYLLTLVRTQAFRKVNATLISKQPLCEHLRNVNDRDYWYCAIRHMTATIYHPVGTTKMGLLASKSVVNHYLKVHNMKSLRVVDAGVMPEIISGHTNVPTYMIAEKASRDIKFAHGILW